MLHNYQDLIALFNQEFSQRYNTRLVKGDDEPWYLPANKQCNYHQIIFAHGYYASALHEIAHWCIAGEKRRLLEDYGYWYEPDGRDQQQQIAFEQVEVKPQAIEWAFCLAAQKKFNVSADNLNGYEANTQDFRKAVYQQALNYVREGFPARAAQFIKALADLYHSAYPLTSEQFSL